LILTKIVQIEAFVSFDFGIEFRNYLKYGSEETVGKGKKEGGRSA